MRFGLIGAPYPARVVDVVVEETGAEVLVGAVVVVDGGTVGGAGVVGGCTVVGTGTWSRR